MLFLYVWLVGDLASLSGQSRSLIYATNGL